tara:strand:+ start:58 stop:900 length:843 start_codon:yes stop_codon:yes gene_type:complete
MIFKMLTRVQNIFLVTKNLEETSRKFSIFFGRKYNFIGQSKNLGIDIISFGLHKTNICLISPKHSGIWFEPLNNFLKNKGEGIFGISFSSDNIDSDYNNFAKNKLKLSDKIEGNFEGDNESQLKFSFFNILDNNIENLNILISNEIDFQNNKVYSKNNVSKVNQIVIQTENPEAIKDIFEEKLRIRLALDKTFKEWAGRMLFFRLGGVTLEVIEGKDIKQNSQYFGIGWHAENYNNCYNSLLKDGFNLSEIRKGRKKGTLVSTLKKPILNIPTILIGLEE